MNVSGEGPLEWSASDSEVVFAGTALGTEVKNNSTPQVISSCGARDRSKQATTCQQNDREGQPVDSFMSRSSSISNNQNLLGYGPDAASSC